MNSTGNNDWRQNGPTGVAERETGDTLDPFAATYAMTEDDEKDKTDAQEQRPGRKRKRLIGAAIFFLILIAAGAGMWMMLSGGGKKVDLRVRDNTGKADHADHRPHRGRLILLDGSGRRSTGWRAPHTVKRGDKTNGNRFRTQCRALDPLRSHTYPRFSATTRSRRFRERKTV